MKKTLYLIVCLIFTTFTTIQAQNNQGFEALENGDFVTAEKEFKALYSSLLSQMQKMKILRRHLPNYYKILN